MASERKKEELVSLESDVLLSELRKGKKNCHCNSISDGIKKTKTKKGKKASAVNAVLPEGWTVTEIRRKCL